MADREGVRSTVGRVLDAHLHVVDLQTCVDDLTGNPNARWWEQLDCSPEAVAVRVGAADVAGGVLVQAVGAHGFDNSLVLGAAEALGDDWRAMVAVGSTVKDPLSVLDGAVAQGATGLRLFSIPDPWLNSDTAVELVQRCADSGVGPSVCCLAEELPAVARIAAAVPDCEIALDHCGFVCVGGDDRALDRSGHPRESGREAEHRGLRCCRPVPGLSGIATGRLVRCRAYCLGIGPSSGT